MVADKALAQPPPRRWGLLPPLVRDRRARFAWALLLAGLGLVINLLELPVWLGLPLDPSLWTASAFLAGSLPAVLGLLFLGGWWGVVIATIAWLPTLVIWGHPWGWIVTTAEFIWLSLWLVPRAEQASTIGTGRIIYRDVLFWLCLGSPATFLYQHFVNQFHWENALVIAIKYPVNELLFVATGYLIYVAIRIGRGERKKVGLSVRGLVLSMILVSIALPSFFFMLVSLQQLEEAISRSYDQKLELLAVGITAYTPENLDNWNAVDQSALGSADFYRLDRDGRSWSSNPQLFKRLSRDYVVAKSSFVTGRMKLLQPRQELVRNRRWEKAYLDYELLSGKPSEAIEDYGQDIKVVTIVESVQPLVIQAQQQGREMLLMLAAMLALAVVVSDAAARRFSREFEIVLVPVSKGGGSADPSGEEQEHLAVSMPSLHASPIIELDAMVDVLNGRIHQINTLTADLRKANQELEKSRNHVQQLLAVSDQQMQTARQIQQSFLVDQLPEAADYDLAYFLRSAYQVGADWYDVLPLEDHLFIVVADVCDKGVGSALFMSVFRSLLRYTIISEFSGPGAALLEGADSEAQLARVVHIVNQYMARNHGGSTMFATVFLACFHPETRQLQYVCAGHEAPLIVRPAEIEALRVTGSAIGIFENASFQGGSSQLNPGDVLVAYTDGLTDARSRDQVSWGAARLRALLGRHAAEHRTSAEWVELITATVFAHMDGEEQFDDLTLMVLKPRG